MCPNARHIEKSFDMTLENNDFDLNGIKSRVEYECLTDLPDALTHK